MPDIRNLLTKSVDAAYKAIQHELAHISEGTNVFTDHCPAEVVADRSRGLEGQIAHLLASELADDTVLSLADDFNPDFDSESREDAMRVLLAADPTEVANAIEDETDLFWQDGDVVRLTCPILADADNWNFGGNLLSVECEGEHIRACIAYDGEGPTIYVTRDLDETRIEGYWGGETVVRRDSDLDKWLDWLEGLVY